MRKIQKISAILGLVLMISSIVTGKIIGQDKKDLERISSSYIVVFDSALKKGILDAWYPLVIDSVDGGYLSNLSSEWKPFGSQPKMLVSQSRHVWTSSQAGLFYHDTTYSKFARHGFEFMRKYIWDPKYGGFFNLRSKNGGDINGLYRNEKRAYGNSFAIYGLTSYYNLTKDTAALGLAKKTFLWLEKYSHDSVYGGYMDIMGQDGIWLAKSKTKSKSGDAVRAAYKDFNSSIHLLEAFTELYKAWPDKLVKERLLEMFTLVRDTFINNKGSLTLYFTEKWKPVSYKDSTEILRKKNFYYDVVSFGHDVETAFLLLEASYALEIENDTATLRIAKKMVDHSLRKGFDSKYGGFFYEGYYMSGSDSVTIVNKEKSWWVQAEGLNALLLMWKIFPAEQKYYDAFFQQWSYIDNYVIDKKYGDWYISGLDYNPEAKKAPKATIWKVNYHNGRALMNCIRLLKNENEVANHFKALK